MLQFVDDESRGQAGGQAREERLAEADDCRLEMVWAEKGWLVEWTPRVILGR